MKLSRTLRRWAHFKSSMGMKGWFIDFLLRELDVVSSCEKGRRYRGTAVNGVSAIIRHRLLLFPKGLQGRRSNIAISMVGFDVQTWNLVFVEKIFTSSPGKDEITTNKPNKTQRWRHSPSKTPWWSPNLETPRWENPNVKMSSLQAYQVPWSTGWGEDLVDESLRYFPLATSGAYGFVWICCFEFKPWSCCRFDWIWTLISSRFFL